MNVAELKPLIKEIKEKVSSKEFVDKLMVLDAGYKNLLYNTIQSNPTIKEKIVRTKPEEFKYIKLYKDNKFYVDKKIYEDFKYNFNINDNPGYWARQISELQKGHREENGLIGEFRVKGINNLKIKLGVKDPRRTTLLYNMNALMEIDPEDIEVSYYTLLEDIESQFGFEKVINDIINLKLKILVRYKFYSFHSEVVNIEDIYQVYAGFKDKGFGSAFRLRTKGMLFKDVVEPLRNIVTEVKFNERDLQILYNSGLVLKKDSFEHLLYKTKEYYNLTQKIIDFIDKTVVVNPYILESINNIRAIELL